MFCKFIQQNQKTFPFLTISINLKVSHQCATQSWDQHLPDPATKGLFLSSCCQGKGTSATSPFPDVAKSILDSSPSPLIFLMSFFWALMQSNLKQENHLFMFLDRSKQQVESQSAAEAGRWRSYLFYEGEGGNARHKEWLSHAYVPYPSDHCMMLKLPEI